VQIGIRGYSYVKHMLHTVAQFSRQIFVVDKHTTAQFCAL
jgi:hypothetical protein